MEYKYPRLEVKKKTGIEGFINADTEATVQDYWAWAHSDINSNAERGKYAEFLVSLAMGCADGTSEEWGAYDVHSNEDIKIEVKTSGYLQTWAHNELSVIRFSIAQSHGWDGDSSEYDDELKRQSDIYVFCVENHKGQDTLNPLDLNQWDFYPVLTSTLNESVGAQKSIGLNSLKNLGASRCGFSELRETILTLTKPEK